jgi:hypothetical protein
MFVLSLLVAVAVVAVGAYAIAIMLITRCPCNIIIAIHGYNCTLLPPKNYSTCVYICGLQWLIIIIIIFFFFFFLWCRQQLSADL